MTRVIVTGGAGFLGRHFLDACEARGWNTTYVDVAHLAALRDPYHMRVGGDALRWFANVTPDPNTTDLLIHCAAVVGGRQVIEHDPMAQVIDFQLDAAMFQWAVRTETPVVYVSSSAVYPTAYQENSRDGLLLEETEAATFYEFDPFEPTPYLPDALYGWTKLTGERIAQEARRHIPVHIIRPFSGYGPDQDLAYPFPSFIDRARRQASPFEVWGDGDQVRDWIHVSDIVSATLTMVDQDIPGPVNLCTGIGTSMDELAAQCMAVAGYEVPIQHNLGAPSGVSYRVGDPSLLNTFYQPRVTLEQGVREALKQEAT